MSLHFYLLVYIDMIVQRILGLCKHKYFTGSDSKYMKELEVTLQTNKQTNMSEFDDGIYFLYNIIQNHNVVRYLYIYLVAMMCRYQSSEFIAPSLLIT